MTAVFFKEKFFKISKRNSTDVENRDGWMKALADIVITNHHIQEQTPKLLIVTLPEHTQEKFFYWYWYLRSHIKKGQKQASLHKKISKKKSSRDVGMA